MLKKSIAANIIFTVALCYIISPWILERTFFLNEILSLTGFLLLVRHKFRIGNDTISISIILLLLYCGVHLITSLFRMDGVYYYFRNSVIVYSIFSYFIGYYCLRYLESYIKTILPFFKFYVLTFLIFPSTLFFERFGMAILYPALALRINRRSLGLLILINIIYGIVYSSSTIILLSGFYIFIALCPGYRFFKWACIFGLACFTALFIYLVPYLNMIEGYDPYHYYRVYNVINAHPLLSIDPNSTWRLIFWKQILIDNFPGNILGLGLGTPVMRYFPVEDFNKLHTLPYVFGAHNSYLYLFGRLGIPYIAFIIVIYRYLFREYFFKKDVHYKGKSILLFWSFFAISVICSFNPVLESPIFASSYWLILGFVARAIHNRKVLSFKSDAIEGSICT